MHTKFWLEKCEGKNQVDISCNGTSQKGNDTRPPLPLYHSQTRPHQKHNQAWRVASKLIGTDVKRIHCPDWHAVFPFPDGRILPELTKRQKRED